MNGLSCGSTSVLELTLGDTRPWDAPACGNCYLSIVEGSDPALTDY